MQLLQVTDLNNPALAVYTKLNENGLKRIYEPELGLFIAETDKVIARALEAGNEAVSFLLEQGLTDKFADLIASAEAEGRDSVPVYVAEYELLTQLTGYTLTRGILCAMRRKNPAKLTEVLQNATRVMVMEEVMNPTNVGAIFRSAAALGMDAVLLTEGCADPLYRRAIRVGMGTVFQIPWTYLEKTWLTDLKEQGFCTVAMALREDSFAIEEDALLKAEKLAVIMGTEGEGLREETIAACDYTVMIPMTHGVDSLNVAAASAVACFVLGKGRKG